MAHRILGIHHITAICSDAQKNFDFYSGVLGLKLVKRTVNFDDPGAYHLYYGDSLGNPGTILTFFAWPGAGRGRIGNSQVTAASFAISPPSLSYWTARLSQHGISYHGPVERFGEQVLTLSDPDGMSVELVATAGMSDEHALGGFHSSTLSEFDHKPTAELLTGKFGFKLQQTEGNRHRFAIDSNDPGAIVDVVDAPDGQLGRVSVGTIHHIAWRTANDEQQAEWRQSLTETGYHPSPVMDRLYFHSIYFREPGGILFEIATDPPGFTFDEPASELGLNIALPPWLEESRREIERALPPLEVTVRV